MFTQLWKTEVTPFYRFSFCFLQTHSWFISLKHLWLLATSLFSKMFSKLPPIIYLEWVNVQTFCLCGLIIFCIAWIQPLQCRACKKFEQYGFISVLTQPPEIWFDTFKSCFSYKRVLMILWAHLFVHNIFFFPLLKKHIQCSVISSTQLYGCIQQDFSFTVG